MSLLGKWRGWPYDYWSCCQNNQTQCSAPNPSLKVFYKEKPKVVKIEMLQPEVPLPQQPSIDFIENVRKDEYFGQGSFNFNMSSASTTGNGVVNFQNGMYDGQIVDNIPHGIGKFVYYDTKTEYEGEVVQGYFDGIGELKCGFNRYAGSFKNHKKDGRGAYYYEDGSVYEGEFKNDLREGKGKLAYADGDSFEGEFKEGMRHGKGYYKFSNGDEYTGSYSKDLRDGKGKYKIAATGKEFSGLFKAGCLVQGTENLPQFVAENASSYLKAASKSSKRDPNETYANFVKNNSSKQKKASQNVRKSIDSVSKQKKDIQVKENIAVANSNENENTELGEKVKYSKSSNNILAAALKTIEKKVNTLISSTEMMKDMEKQKQIIRVLQQEISDLKNHDGAKALKYLKKKDEDKQKDIAMSAKAWKPPIAPKYLTNNKSEAIPVPVTKYVTRAEKEESTRKSEEIRSKLIAPSDVNVKLSKPKPHFSRRDASSISPTRRIITTSSPIKTNNANKKNDTTNSQSSNTNSITQVTVSNYEAAAMLILAADLAVSNNERFLQLANDDYTNIPQVIFEKNNDNKSDETLVIKKQAGILDARFNNRKDVSADLHTTNDMTATTTTTTKTNTKNKANDINIKDIIGDSSTWWNDVMKKKNQIEMKELYEI